MKTNNILSFLLIVFSLAISAPVYAMPSCGDAGYEVPANNHCADAHTLVEGVEECGFTTMCSSNQAGECITNFAGGDNTAVWFRFEATSPEMVFNLMATDPYNFTRIRYYGPYAPGGGCLPGCADAIINVNMQGDPGKYLLLQGLNTTAGNNEYLIQIQRPDTGAGDGGSFCAGIYEPVYNNSPGSPSVIHECGIEFEGTTAGGIYPAGAGVRYADYTGDGVNDVPYVTNNDSWFTFCPSATGDYEVDFNNVSCFYDDYGFLSGGSQFSVLIGPPDASTLTNIYNGPNPIASGGSVTTPSFTVNSGDCAFLYVDGFAGDGCEYSYEVRLVSGGACGLLPVELLTFKALKRADVNELIWVTETETNNWYFTIEYSSDGSNWRSISTVPGAGNSSTRKSYNYEHKSFSNTVNYYRLSQTDFDGTTKTIGYVSLDNSNENIVVKTVNLIGQEVDENYKGIVIDIYNDGSRQKRFQ